MLLPHRSLWSCVLAGAFVASVWSSVASAQRVAGPDEQKLAEIPKRMQEFVDSGDVSGIVTLVATRDQVVHLAAVGKSDLASGRDMKTDDLFWIASMTKPIVGVAIGILVDEGKLSFDDPLEKHLPEFVNRKVQATGGARRGRGGGGDNAPPSPPVPADRPPTIRDVLTHTSGFGEMPQRNPHLTLRDLSRDLAERPLQFQPGTRWRYSTAGIDLLGRIVEVVSKQTFDKFLQERIFDPLQMTESTFWISPEQLPRFAISYRREGEAGPLTPANNPYMYNTEVTDRQRAPFGGAGLFCTAADMARFYQMVLRGGEYNGQRIISAATLKEILTKQTGDLEARPGMPWGLAFVIVEDPGAMEANHMLSPGSYGHGGAHGTGSWVDPQHGAIYILMLQRAGLNNPDNSDMHRVFQEVADAAFEGR